MAYEQAPEVTRKRLYIDTMEGVMSRANKVIVDEKGGNGNMIYLPLDKLLERTRNSSSNSDGQEATVRVSPEPDSTASDPRSRGER